jgi:hypothetical protein
MIIVTPVTSATRRSAGGLRPISSTVRSTSVRAPGGGERLQLTAGQVLVVEQPGTAVLTHKIGKHMLVRKHDSKITWLHRAGHRHDLHAHILAQRSAFR